MSEWISVKDRLPEKKGHYLVYIKGDFYRKPYIRQFLNEKWFNQPDIILWDRVGDLISIDSCKPLKKVTHWMSLPERPQ